eukprot:TRINITY_DN4809_c0_g1_i1.p1 TRINITY_DN4809_c0_g1~~TRINITY_DN4809_c0_g1_i1.p1  ORF type:complete len:565 (+),score=68.31 TRINITY_DN4809_c0_g1_i1:831-2525(+)
MIHCILKRECCNISPSFGQLSKVTELNLSGNMITDLHESIGEMGDLTKLCLDYNILQEIPIAIECLDILEQLYLSGNNLTVLPHSVSNLRNLQILDLSLNKNMDSIILQHLTKLSSLTELHISTNLKRNFTANESMTRLNLNCTKLPSFSCHKELTELNLGNGRLTSIPPAIFELANLETFYIHNNELDNLNGDWSSLSSLVYLNLSGNVISELSSSICVLSGLEELDCSHNHIQSISKDLAHLRSLRYFDISFNVGIKNIPEEFSEIPNLKWLNISNCRLDNISPKLLERTYVCALFNPHIRSTSARLLLSNRKLSKSLPVYFCSTNGRGKESMMCNFLVEHKLVENGSVFGLFHGHTDASFGCSKIFVERFMNYYNSVTNPEILLSETLTSLHTFLLETMGDQMCGVSCTIIFLLGSELFVCTIGDTKAYFASEMYDYTSECHIMSNSSEVQRIIRYGGHIYKHEICSTRALGYSSISPRIVSPTPAITRLELKDQNPLYVCIVNNSVWKSIPESQIRRFFSDCGSNSMFSVPGLIRDIALEKCTEPLGVMVIDLRKKQTKQ